MGFGCVKGIVKLGLGVGNWDTGIIRLGLGVMNAAMIPQPEPVINARNFDMSIRNLDW